MVKRRLSARLTAIVLSGLFACAVAGTGVKAQSAPAAGAEKPTDNSYGDWKFRCENPPGAVNQQCSIQQSVVDDQSPDMTLKVVVLGTADGKGRIMRIIAPLGVFVPTGVELRIGQTKIGGVGFTRCLKSGCIVDVQIGDSLVDLLKNGQSATFIVFKNPEQGVGIPISLTGFAAAYDRLMNIRP